ncbi:hypothetical protein ACFSC4_30755 [Deinococcus malanensis]|uniref:hypothetical protein n=1 Tax=Deinococcus malanensis TaxID=1706855 RepID=UPI00362E88F5
MLIVIGIIGVLMGLAMPTYLGWLAASEAQQAATTLAQEIQRVRTDVKRATLSTTGAQPQASLTTTANSTSFTAAGRTVSLSNARIQTARTLTFEAPYGTLVLPTGTSLPLTITVSSSRNATKTRTVRVISLLGKVVVQ